jgi:hypothetical protein
MHSLEYSSSLLFIIIVFVNLEAIKKIIDNKGQRSILLSIILKFDIKLDENIRFS